MAFNNPSSRTPVSYGSATKSLGYIVGTLGRAFSSDDDEGAQLLSKKKAKGESRFMAYACCCCCAILVGTVGTFIWALQSMTYPGQVKGAGIHQLKQRAKFDPSTGTYRLGGLRSFRKGLKGSRGRNVGVAHAQRNVISDSLIGADGRKFAVGSLHFEANKK